MKNLEIIKHYQTIFSCDQFIITGSTALKMHGLVDSSSDIDIILVNPTEECKKIIEKLEEKSNKQNTYKESVAYIFKHEDVKIDIFIETVKVDCCSYEGVFINPIKKIVEAKKKIARTKDFAQLRKIASSILTEKELMDYLDSKA
jgi:hypothetical protein